MSCETNPGKNMNSKTGCIAGAFCGILAAGVCAVLLIAAVAGVFLLLTKESEYQDEEGNVFVAAKFRETYMEGARNAADKIAVIPVTGVIVSDAKDSFYDVADSGFIRTQLRQAAADPSVRAIIINLNTPGGEVTASDEIYEEIMNIRRKKPVVAMMNSIAASGGYYIAAACRPIIANKLTLTGSIGVIISTYNYHQLFQKIGVQAEVYTSGSMKDMLNGARPRTPQEVEVIQKLVNNTYDVFVNIVSKSRNIPAEKIRSTEIGDGRIFDGPQALKLGLVDRLGYFKDAVHAAAAESGIQDLPYTVIKYEEPFSFSRLLSLLGARSSIRSVNLSLQGQESTSFRPQKGHLYYLPSDF